MEKESGMGVRELVEGLDDWDFLELVRKEVQRRMGSVHAVDTDDVRRGRPEATLMGLSMMLRD